MFDKFDKFSIKVWRAVLQVGRPPVLRVMLQAMLRANQQTA